ncbi:signal transduction histidine kinase [Methylobacterium sp.]|nr:signal transduction histidine kinase [Methylobacterium sp.]
MALVDARQPDQPIVWVNDAFTQQTGYGRHEVVGRNCRMLQGPDSDRAEVARIRAAIAAGQPCEVELFNYRKDGTRFWNAMTINPVRNAEGVVTHFYSAQADMTEKQRLEQAMRNANDELERLVDLRTADLSAALEQKTALLHEVDHRVKNNLQVISSLILLKARRTPEGEARDALQGIAERVGALSTAHRMLYSAGDATRFNLQDFAADLLSDLNAGLDPERTHLEGAFDPIAVSAAMAAPLALMIHELTTNALRHAFPGDRAGRVTIEARRQAEALHITIGDDGVGLGSAAPNPAGFGRSLVEMVVRQLRGAIAWHENAPGTRVEIRIPLGSED